MTIRFNHFCERPLDEEALSSGWSYKFFAPSSKREHVLYITRRDSEHHLRFSAFFHILDKKSFLKLEEVELTYHSLSGLKDVFVPEPKHLLHTTSEAKLHQEINRIIKTFTLNLDLTRDKYIAPKKRKYTRHEVATKSKI